MPNPSPTAKVIAAVRGAPGNRVKVAVSDIDGVLRGKYLHKEKFYSAAESGLGFCDVVFGWDIGDTLLDNVTFTGWHTSYPDAMAVIDLDTFRLIPWEPGTALFLLDLFEKGGQPLAMSPRHERLTGRFDLGRDYLG